MEGASSKTKELKGTEKRDAITSWERECQAKWEKEGVFEVNPPSIDDIPLASMSGAELREKQPRWHGNIAYPYMNGALHAGHSFSISKVEFQAGVARLQGKTAMFPMGFHCTGMPIKACADKLVNEIAKFGRNFENYKEEDEAPEPVKAAAAPKLDPTKFKATKGKAAAKNVKAKYQFQIMQSIGIPTEDIHQFADPNHWITFFSPLAQRDLKSFGARIDWRRSFVTTDLNPFYDSFVRWHMRKLKQEGRIKFGKRYTIYSIKDGQPCLDHDRSSGEAINPQEYVAIKLKVLEWAPKAAEAVKDKVPEGASVFLVPATLRPETMYGQTCCFVGPKLKYGVYRASEKEYFVITERAARNMAYQGIFESNGVIKKVAEIEGSELIGSVIHAPLSLYPEIRVLPMETVLASKGTGVVTCVPSDSPDDYATVADLAKKPEYYGIEKEWVDKEIIPLIQTPSYGDKCAEFLVKELKISSPKDTVQLAKVKELSYKEGFYQGVMKVGDFAGEKVEVAKPKVRQQLIDAGDAFVYSEPEGLVISRSGDECIVAMMDQWFIEYGEEEWKKTALDYVENGLNTYSAEAKNAFEGVLNWLKDWAVSRNFGLGSRLPWDEKVLVESLSDSTIYMAYYTVCNLLHTDIYGKVKGPANVEAAQMTDEVWDYIFARREWDETIVEISEIPKRTLETMRRSFEYFYPVDIRVSGRDLIPNHLTFCLYNHIAMFSREYWPRSIRANGHLMLNGEKMAKSTGNFLTLSDLVAKYGADAARIALADAGDSISDANFDEDVADNSILRLYTLREWCEETVNHATLRTGELNSYQDRFFENEMNAAAVEAISQYEATNYKLALKAALYDLSAARDFYREACIASSIPLHAGLVEKWTKLLALLLLPITPHFSEYLWVKILKQETSIHKETFPKVPAVDPVLSAAREYIKETASNVNSAESAQLRKKAKGKTTTFDPKKPKKLTICVSSTFPTWQEKYVDLLREMWDVSLNTVNDKDLNGKIGKMGEMKKAMPFVQSLKKRLAGGEPVTQVLDRKLSFDEVEILTQMVPGLKRSAGLKEVEILLVKEEGKKVVDLEGKEVALPVSVENAVPGSPVFYFENVE
ncbi:probable leucine--tRNA ligase, cytosolic [Cephalotrichum gorgonifer]|uniref:leucine--tRNA ligase n=1 Tax=Cephalotrichum gorgonifer TaxID=2041049 RepID=A0AAE8N1U5_9PEZI|nr:probable leucine--tRNA ligase, cytosolic [Cephalotrichum gorgonifer]